MRKKNQEKVAWIAVICLIVAASIVSYYTTPVPGRFESIPDYLSLFKESYPAEVDNSILPVTPIGELHPTGSPQAIDIDEYRLDIDGLVATPRSLSYEELLSYPTITEKVLLICRPFWVDNAVWTGVPLEILLEEADILPNASLVVFYGADRYSKEIPYSYLKEASVFLAYEVNGQLLPLEHGYPLRLVVEGKLGNKWVKWIERIEVK